MKNIVIATIKEWNIDNYFELKKELENEYSLYLISNKDELSLENIKKINPKYIFFPHWSWIIPKNIYENFECILFHMTDLPYGRGGSPLQNLIINRVYNTKISALRVTKGLDEGDIYLKEDFDISKGSANEIYINASKLIFKKLIPNILKQNPKPVSQDGIVVNFKRRTPEESNINSLKEPTITTLYDFIRMLDAPTYPKAYLELESLKIEFKDVFFNGTNLEGKFEVIEK